MSDNVIEFNKREEEEKCIALEMAEDYIDVLLDAKDPAEMLDILHSMCHAAITMGRVSEVQEDIDAKEDYLQFLISGEDGD
jgi:hypothetical protein